MKTMKDADGKELRWFARVPVSVVNRAFIEGWFHDKAAWLRWANDPANAEYRKPRKPYVPA